MRNAKLKNTEILRRWVDLIFAPYERSFQVMLIFLMIAKNRYAPRGAFEAFLIMHF